MKKVLLQLLFIALLVPWLAQGQTAATIPYSCDFENATENTNWTLENGTLTNKWFVGTGVNNGTGTHGLYISNDGGVTNNYANNSATCVYAWRELTIANAGEYTISFDWRCGGESTYDFIRVALVPATTTLTGSASLPSGLSATGLPSGWIALDGGSKLNLSSSWQPKVSIINISTIGNYKLVFCWRNDGSAGIQPPAAIDNIVISQISCPRPTVSIENITQISADVVWTNIQAADHYVLEYGVLGFAQGTGTIEEVYDIEYSLTNLNANTAYDVYVRSDCNGDTSIYQHVSFRTACGEMIFPYSENFNSYASGTNQYLPCWFRPVMQGSFPYIESGSNSYGGSGNSIKFAGAATVVTPRVPVTAHEIEVAFKMKREGTSSGTIQVGFVPHPDSISAFELVGTVNPRDNLYHDYEFSFANASYTDTGYIAFKQVSTETNWYYWLDNVVITRASSCAKPYNGIISNISNNSADLSWNDSISAYAYTVKWGTVDNVLAATDSMDVYDVTTMLTNLVPRTTYYVWVRTDCGSELSNWLVLGSFTTNCNSVRREELPFFEGFENWTTGLSAITNNFDPCWKHYSNYTPSFYYPYISASYAYEGTKSMHWGKGASNYSYAVLPIFDVAVDSLQVSFYLKKINDSYFNGVQVGIMTDPTDLNTFVSLGAYSPSAINVWEKFTVYLHQYTGTGRYIAFYAPITYASSNVYMDNVEVNFLPACGAVADLQVSNITSGSASLYWEPSTLGSLTNYTVEYRNAADTNAGWTTVAVSTHYYFLSNLALSTTYDVRVATVCSEGNSLYSNIKQFTTRACISGGSIRIGDGSVSSSINPVVPYYEYSYTQQIYPAVSLAGVDTIYGIGFNYTSTASETRTITVYAALTTQSSFTSVTNYIPVSSLSQLYSGSYTFQPGWNYITFTTPMIYDGSSNIVVAIDDNTGSYSDDRTFSAHNAGNNASICFFQDEFDISPSSPSASAPYGESGVTTIIPDIIFMTPCNNHVSCLAPNLLISENSQNQIDLVWTAGLHETSWVIEYKHAGDTAWIIAGTVSSTTYSLTGLTTGALYDVRVGAICGSETLYTTVSVRTECGIYTLPYVEDFNLYANNSSAISPCWHNMSITSSRDPYIQNIMGEGKMLLCPPTSYVALPEFDAEINTLQTRFRYAAADTTVMCIVGVMTDPARFTTFYPIDTFNIVTNGMGENFTCSFANYADTGKYIAFYSPNDNMYLDNITIELIPACGIPSLLSVASITTTSANVSWVDNGGLTTSWLVEYGHVGFTEGTGTIVAVSGNPTCTLSGLSHSTSYQFIVKTICSNNDTSIASNRFIFTTLCDAISEFPYSQNFDNCNTPALTYTGILPNCWFNPHMYVSTTTANYLPQIYSSASTANSGDYCLRMYYRGLVTLPEIAVALDTLQLTFSMKAGSLTNKLIVGVVDSVSAGCQASFIPIDTIYNTSTSSYETHVIYLANYTGNGRILAFQNNASYSSAEIYIDDVVLEYTPSCLPPQNFRSTSNTMTSVTLSWTDLRNATQWEIYYDTARSVPTSGIVVTTNPYTVNNLLSGATYQFYVRSICAAGDTGAWSGPIRVIPGTYNMPVSGTDTAYMCEGMIYDDGGIFNQYVDNCNGMLVVYPSILGNAVSLTGNYVTESGYDKITIYSGVGTSGDILVNEASGTGTIHATSEDATGALTIKFISDGSEQRDGFAFQVQCVPNTCPPVRNLEAVNINNTNAQIVWSEQGSATQWEVEYGMTDFAQGQGVSLLVTDTSYMLTNLDSQTGYDVYVRAVCSAGDSSRWRKTHFTTHLCSNINLVTVGSGNTGTNSLPINTFYNYSYTQQIYEASEIDTTGSNTPMNISSIAFQYFNTTPQTKNNISMYLGHTQDTAFASNTTWIPLNSMQLVFSGTVELDRSINVNYWNEIVLDTTFLYNGTDNLVVAVLNNDADYLGSSNTFYVHAVTNYKSLIYRDDDDPFDFASSSAGTRMTERNNIQFLSCSFSCSEPSGLASVPSATSAVITWNETGNFEIAYRETSASNWSAPIAVNNMNTCMLTGLNPQTAHTYRVRQNCDTLGYSNWSEAAFITPELPCTAPTSLTSANITYTSATITWTDATQNQVSWKVLYGYGAHWDTLTTTATSVSLTDLYANTQYTVRVMGYCSIESNIHSDWSDPYQFFTTICQGVSNVNATEIKTDRVTLTWTPGTGQTTWELSYGTEGTNEENGTKITVNGTPSQLLGNLLSDMTYDVYVRNICSEGITSAWTTKYQFKTTLGIHSASADAMEVRIYPNPATNETMISVNGVDGKVELVITDMNGRIVTSETVYCKRELVKTLDVSKLAKGAYFINIYNETFNTTRKLIVR